MIATALASREPAVFALTAPTIWITIAVYHDEGGEEHVAVARIAAWHEQDACAFLEDRLLEDTFGVPADEIRSAWLNDEDGLGERLWIAESLAVSTNELNAAPVQGTEVAQRAFMLTRRATDHAAPTP
jgi:hypothetical protein